MKSVTSDDLEVEIDQCCRRVAAETVLLQVLEQNSSVEMQAAENLEGADLAASTAGGGTLPAGSDRIEVAHNYPACWLSECVQNCHSGVKGQREGLIGEGP